MSGNARFARKRRILDRPIQGGLERVFWKKIQKAIPNSRCFDLISSEKRTAWIAHGDFGSTGVAALR